MSPTNFAHTIGRITGYLRFVPKSFHSKRSIVNAILYVLKTACQWRMLGHDLPPWQSVYDHYRRWKKRWTVERTFAFWLMPKMDCNIFFYS